MDNIPVSKIRSAPKGLVKLVGRLEKSSLNLKHEKNYLLLKEPQVNKDAIIWFARILARRIYAKGWVDLFAMFGYKDVLLNDGTGTVQILFEKDTLFDSKPTAKFTKSELNKYPEEFLEFKKLCKLGQKDLTHGGLRRYEEISFIEGEEVEIVGYLDKKVVDGKEVLVITSKNSDSLTIRKIKKEDRILNQSSIYLLGYLALAIFMVSLGGYYILLGLNVSFNNTNSLIAILLVLGVYAIIYYKLIR